MTSEIEEMLVREIGQHTADIVKFKIMEKIYQRVDPNISMQDAALVSAGLLLKTIEDLTEHLLKEMDPPSV